MEKLCLHGFYGERLDVGGTRGFAIWGSSAQSFIVYAMARHDEEGSSIGWFLSPYSVEDYGSFPRGGFPLEARLFNLFSMQPLS
ncbi:hypothetical protein NC653_028429 [Populus alba x Populus x berolinensis]|uniref:Uncharacterized protein n=1 Tax=Populus alba x Populus x berolinensis TaxID=444605 RepID=A0AAD6Q672_9ROSI|nr:hypothetical protein NC653_028429 [Populus alba x Populus x berolinensis]